MIGVLPKSLTVGNKEYEIRTDFRVILRIYEAFEDSELTENDKAEVCVRCLYPDYNEIPFEDMQEAVDKAYWFVGGGDMPHSKPEEIKMLDWKQDESILVPAVSRAAGVPDIRECAHIHWWTFLGLFGEIGEGLFSTVMNIRQKKAKGKPLETWEKEFYRKNADLINIRTDEDDEAAQELNAVLEELI